MSVRVMTWVFEHSQATGNDRVMLLAIADRCDDDGTNCWMSTMKLAAKCRISRRTAQRCIDNLIESGEVEIVERPGTTNLLNVLMEGRQVDAPSEREQRGVNLTPVPTRDTRVTSGAGGASPVTPDTSLNRPSSPQPPASGGRHAKAHCDEHKRFRRSCPDCVAADQHSRRRPEWCGECNPDTRHVEADDGTLIGRCPACHPNSRRTA